MIRLSLFSVFLTLLCSNMLYGASFEDANAYYAAGKYQQAQQTYLQIIEEKGYSANLCYNLANSYAKLGQNGMAILYYKRALRLDPHNADIHHNLKRIQEENHLFKEGAIDKIFAAHNLNLWTFTALFFFVVIIILVALSRRPLFTSRYQIIYPLTTAFLCCVTSIVFCFFTYQNWPASIVIKQSDLLLSPFDGAQKKGKIVEGQTVFSKKYYGDYIQIEENGGRSGWVKTITIEKI